MISIGIPGSIVRAHHIFTMDLDINIHAYFTIITIIIVVLTKIKTLVGLLQCREV